MAEAIAVAAVVVASSAVVSKQMGDSQREKAKKEASKAAEAAKKQFELQAGEYDEINKKQMAVNALQSQTANLSKLLIAENSPPRILTLPSAESTAPLDRINRAIDDWIKGA